jgi:sporulation protein YlmC with PRC-barrel domain
LRHPTRAGIGLIRLGDSDFVPQNPEDDLRGKAVYDAQGQRMGSVSNLYIDPQDREVRFLEVGAGGFLGMGEKRYLVLVEAVTEVAEDRVTIEPGRTEKVDGPAPFDTKVALPPADKPPDAYVWLPYGNAESPADPRDSSLRDIHRPD